MRNNDLMGKRLSERIKSEQIHGGSDSAAQRLASRMIAIAEDYFLESKVENEESKKNNMEVNNGSN